MKYALCCVTDSNYLLGCQVSLYSFIKNNKWFNGDVVIYKVGNIEDQDYKLFKKIYDKIIFKDIKTDDYVKLIKHVGANSFLDSAYYKFEAFQEDSYDKVIVVDSDMVIINSIEECLSWGDLTISIDTQCNDTSFTVKKRNEEYINSGFLVIGKKYLSKSVRDDIIKFGEEYDFNINSVFNPFGGNREALCADQDVLSCYFSNRDIDICSNKFNQKFFFFDREKDVDTKIIHFLGDNKPWVGGRLNGDYWYSYFYELNPTRYLIRLNYDVYTYYKDTRDENKVILCACAKNENDYILEWVNHHLSIGFDKIILADNNDDDSLEEILKDYVDKGQVQILNFRGFKKFQIQFYDMILNAKNYQWCAFFDVDEFLEISPKYDTVKDFLNDCDGDCVMVNWLMYGPDNILTKQKGDVQERFKNPVYPICMFKENMFYKTIVRRFEGSAKFTSPHEIKFEDENKLYNTGGYYLSKTKVDQVSYPVRYKKAWLKHYYTKSYQEYMEKMTRGWADANDLSRLKNPGHFALMDSSDKISMIKFYEHIFSKGDNKFTSDAVENYDVIVYTSPENNYFSLLVHLGIALSMATDHTFVVNDDIDETIYLILFELAMKTGNRLIAVKGDANAYWNMYQKYNKGKNQTYYIVTC